MVLEAVVQLDDEAVVTPEEKVVGTST